MYSHHALVLFRVPNLSEESSCHAWRVEWWQPTEGSDMKPHILSMTPLPCLGDSVESDDGYSGDMSIVQLILGTDRSVPLEGQGGVADVSMTAPRFSCNSDQVFICVSMENSVVSYVRSFTAESHQILLVADDSELLAHTEKLHRRRFLSKYSGDMQASTRFCRRRW